MLELFRRMWVAWNRGVRGIFVVQNTVLMTIAWLVGLAPIAVALKLMRRPMLDRAPADPRAQTHWRPRRGKPMRMEEAARRF